MYPYIHLNFAVDQRGRHCGPEGERIAISCEEDWHRVHLLREKYDAVAVGGRTWNLDRPSLRVRAERLRREPARHPARVVFANNHFCQVSESGTPDYVIGETSGNFAGTTVIASAGRELRRPLKDLRRHGIQSMIVEGGPTLLRSFLIQDCFDEVTVFVRGAEPTAAFSGAMTTLPGLPAEMESVLFGAGSILAYSRHSRLHRRMTVRAGEEDRLPDHLLV